MAITLISEKLFSVFDRPIGEGKALAYGQGYPGNALACAGAKASLEVFENERVLEALQPEIQCLGLLLDGLEQLPAVKEVRQCGFIEGIELAESSNTAGSRVAVDICIEARSQGRLTRPLGIVVILMPPLCATVDQLPKAVNALRLSIIKVCGDGGVIAKNDAEEITA